MHVLKTQTWQCYVRKMDANVDATNRKNFVVDIAFLFSEALKMANYSIYCSWWMGGIIPFWVAKERYLHIRILPF